MPKLKVTRTVTHTYECEYPQSYQGMTLDEAVAHERDMDAPDVAMMLSEAMSCADLEDTQFKFAVAVEVTDE